MTVNPDGSGHTNLTNTPTIGDGDENLSPDGMKIAFISNQLDRNFDLWIMNPDGSGRTPLYAARAVKSKVTLGTPRQNRALVTHVWVA
jgi:Tol biopolymer transport system component